MEEYENGEVLLLVICIMHIFVLAACASSTPVPTSAATTGGTSPTTAGPTAALDGKTILKAKCQNCHSLAPVYNTQASADQWTSIVDNMVARGAVLTADKRTVLIAFLAANFK